MNRREFIRQLGSHAATAAATAAAFSLPRSAWAQNAPKSARPNIVFIMADDHAAQAISAYGSKLIDTPNLDRIANAGLRFDNCFCTNAICGPSRAVILTGKYSHINGKIDNTPQAFDGSQQTFPKLLQAAGYQTAMIGKWHLRSAPTGFDYYNILPGQGAYFNPDFIENGQKKKYQGYVTDIITDRCIDWLDQRDPDKPFCLMYHHKAPHRNWQPKEEYAKKWRTRTLPTPETFDDDEAGYPTRCEAAGQQEMTIAKYFQIPHDTKFPAPEGLKGHELKEWKYQRYMQDYLACIDSVDENVGRFLDYLDQNNLAKNTLVIYTSDQGFFLGEHGWFDKRFMYEESLRMPFLARWPGVIKPQTTNDDMVLNLDFAPTFLQAAGVPVPSDIQGESFLPILKGNTPPDWRTAMYYHFYEYPAVHMAKRHYGLRTKRYKLIHFYYDVDCWELYDLQTDPNELHNLYNDPAYADLRAQLTGQLHELQTHYGDSLELAHSFLPKTPQNRRN